jgi:microcompartment protein CcmK/EutM
MKLGKVVGTIVSTRKDEKIEGLKLFLVQDLSPDAKASPDPKEHDPKGAALKEREAFVVAADAMGAGVGEVVLYASGSSARQTKMTDGRPIDAVIMAIVDTVDMQGRLLYDKYTAG